MDVGAACIRYLFENLWEMGANVLTNSGGVLGTLFLLFISFCSSFSFCLSLLLLYLVCPSNFRLAIMLGGGTPPAWLLVGKSWWWVKQQKQLKIENSKGWLGIMASDWEIWSLGERSGWRAKKKFESQKKTGPSMDVGVACIRFLIFENLCEMELTYWLVRWCFRDLNIDLALTWRWGFSPSGWPIDLRLTIFPVDTLDFEGIRVVHEVGKATIRRSGEDIDIYYGLSILVK